MVEDVGFTAVSHNINDFCIALIAIFSFSTLFCGASITSRRFAIADDDSIEWKIIVSVMMLLSLSRNLLPLNVLTSYSLMPLGSFLLLRMHELFTIML